MHKTILRLVLHPSTERATLDYIERPSHALLISGSPGSGKASLAQHIVSQVLGLDATRPELYESHPYIRILRPEDGKAIPVESIRELQQFLSLKIPTTTNKNIARAIIIEEAYLLTAESQNALLKTLEEPPVDTILVLTVPSAESVLTTIRSRVRQLAVVSPGAARLTEHFVSLGYAQDSIIRALMLSGELPGLSAALLANNTGHPLVEATTHARGILGTQTYERLLLVDGLSKQKPLCIDILFVLAQMSRMALMRSTDDRAALRWRRVLRAVDTASEQLAHNTQTKLVLTNLMLAM